MMKGCLLHMKVSPIVSTTIQIHEVCIPDSIFDQISSPEDALIKLTWGCSKDTAKFFSPKRFEEYRCNDSCVGLHPLLLVGFAADFDGTNVLELEII